MAERDTGVSFLINPFILGGAGESSPGSSFDPANDILNDSIPADASVIQFLYAGAGENPIEAHIDTIPLDVEVVDFSYTP